MKSKFLSHILLLAASTQLEASSVAWSSIPISGTGAAKSLGQSITTNTLTSPATLQSIVIEGTDDSNLEDSEFTATLNVYKSADGSIHTWDPESSQPLATSNSTVIKQGSHNIFNFVGLDAIQLSPNSVYLVQIVSHSDGTQRIAFADKSKLTKTVDGEAFRNTTATDASPLPNYTFGVTVLTGTSSRQYKPSKPKSLRTSTLISIGGVSISLQEK